MYKGFLTRVANRVWSAVTHFMVTDDALQNLFVEGFASNGVETKYSFKFQVGTVDYVLMWVPEDRKFRVFTDGASRKRSFTQVISLTDCANRVWAPGSAGAVWRYYCDVDPLKDPKDRIRMCMQHMETLTSWTIMCQDDQDRLRYAGVMLYQELRDYTEIIGV